MIITVTLNPSLDRTLIVHELVRGEVLRAEAAREDPGGKGVNVARALAAHGEQPCAIFPAGGAIGRALVGALQDAGVEVDPVGIEGTTRANVTVVEPDGTTTKLNEPGPYLGASDIDAVLDAVENKASAGDWVVIGGSLPPGTEPEIVALLVEASHRSGARAALDTSGKGLVAGLGAGPDLVKPNREELADAVGHGAATVADVVASCHELRTLGARQVLCSLGADGALVVDAENELHADAPLTEVRNTVGAGDALLAGYLRSIGRGPTAAIRGGVAWAAAAVATAGTGVPAPDLVDTSAVEVTDLRQFPEILTKELL